jgi:O-antigen/teichoic acid export membrane protein
MLVSWLRSQLKEAKSSSYFQDIALLSSGGLIANIIVVAVMPLASRIYTPESFAIANLVVLWAGFFIVLVTYRLELFVQLPKQDEDAWNLVRLVVFLGILWTVILTPALWFWRETIANLAGQQKLGPWLTAVPITAAALALSTALQGWNQRRGNYRRSAGAEIVSKTGYAGTVIGGRWLLPDAAGLVLATLSSHAVKIAALSVRNRPASYPWDSRNLWAIGRTHEKLAGGMIFAQLCLSCTLLIPAMYISRKYGADALGQYSLAFQTVCLPEALIGNAIGNVYYQRIAEEWVRGGSIQGLFRATAIRLLFICLPLFAVGALISPWIVPVIFGDQWHDAGIFAALLAISSFGSFISTALGRTCIVVTAWWYPPLWHLMRVTTTISVVWIADSMSLGAVEFITLLVFQQLAVFALDFLSQLYFSQRRLKTT